MPNHTKQPPKMPIEANRLLEVIEKAANAYGFEIQEFGKQREYPLISLVKINGEQLPYAYVTAGIHGNEPAPPISILKMISNGVFNNANYNYIICPLLNPYGLSHANRTDHRKDLNRQYNKDNIDQAAKATLSHIRWLNKYIDKIKLVLCLHEDWETDGFYMYESTPKNQKPLSKNILDKVEQNGFKVNKSRKLDDRSATNGVIDMKTAGGLKHTEVTYITDRNPYAHCFVFETPSSNKISARLKTMEIAVKEALDSFGC